MSLSQQEREIVTQIVKRLGALERAVFARDETIETLAEAGKVLADEQRTAFAAFEERVEALEIDVHPERLRERRQEEFRRVDRTATKPAKECAAVVDAALSEPGARPLNNKDTGTLSKWRTGKTKFGRVTTVRRMVKWVKGDPPAAEDPEAGGESSVREREGAAS